MKRTTVTALVLACVCLVACEKPQSKVADASGSQSMVQDSLSAQDAMTCEVTGTVNHDKWEGGQTTSVSFSGIPATLDQFKALQREVGVEPQGALALQVLAFEMFRRDAKLGEEALRLNNTQVNVQSTLHMLKEMMNVKDVFYSRPYIAAALMKGASVENGYQPDKPYTIEMRVDPAKKYQDSQLLGGTVIYLQINSKGWDTNWRGAEVVKPNGSDYYVVSNCPALYTQCKQLQGKWQGLE